MNWMHARTFSVSEQFSMPKARRSRRRFYTIDELRRILGAAQDPYRTFYWLAAETGMRAGELCGLRTDDIDLNRGVVTISQSAWHGKLQDPKSENSVRTFAISTRLRDNLRCFLSQNGDQIKITWSSRRATERLGMPICS
jgi:integrase